MVGVHRGELDRVYCTMRDDTVVAGDIIVTDTPMTYYLVFVDRPARTLNLKPRGAALIPYDLDQVMTIAYRPRPHRDKRPESP